MLSPILQQFFWRLMFVPKLPVLQKVADFRQKNFFARRRCRRGLKSIK
ncbi:MAG: hypothetical protein AVDCRST_MAG74-2342 [uncultured Pyrinomonadaceae bacterium]|uniref:Uncharacterized protein n=1 Tax=uncultured Pyrinomonadaceae bacterium TaxID=2283094 RepID=A0A6J4PCE8_9BACT|nr:MAG: hypothetical protein AVDCRST_MAG74-2342 [uncultured Pyrinomonadaceae bacterium]